MNLWHLYCTTDEADGLREFKAYVLTPGGFRDACALWPEWTGRGSGSCLAGPGALPQHQETPIIQGMQADRHGAGIVLSIRSHEARLLAEANPGRNIPLTIRTVFREGEPEPPLLGGFEAAP